MTVAIRPERSGDASAIGALAEAAFRDHPHGSGTEAAIVAALRRAAALEPSLVADDAGRIVGHVAFSPVAVNGADVGWFALGPLSVLPGRQRRGIGGALVREGLARLRAIGAGGCVLVGDPAYYGRFGFAADAALELDGMPARYVLCLPLRGGGVPGGRLAFHAAFMAP